ncbi:DUF2244 domain-containing protein [Alkalilimnicola ehrlichii]|uniref:DUF2244 domain-containing protein n=1 Tax=Alkalilimnicola ehrlichii TaxID=351052 RepID=A0A3E0X483_9GAMM|nr:DUF2244 domain-containing protein [Alkalilimnicola ehrlichii]RFA39534.1 hypothetical protein CAL65_01845 [Alkalilimnicola ehrlichii]
MAGNHDGFALIALTCLGVAVSLALAGYWLILPFAGVEVMVLYWALHASALRAAQREVIWIGTSEVKVQKGRKRPEQQWLFQRVWTEVHLEPSGHPWYPSRLSLRSRGQEVDIGGFLQENERVALARELKRFIGPMAAPGRGV